VIQTGSRWRVSCIDTHVEEDKHHGTVRVERNRWLRHLAWLPILGDPADESLCAKEDKTCQPLTGELNRCVCYSTDAPRGVMVVFAFCNTSEPVGD
jgi:hypothetical protein